MIKKKRKRYTKKNPSPDVSTEQTIMSRYVNITYGSVVKNIPKSIFILINGWSKIRLGQDEADYDLASRRLNKAIRQYLHNTLNRDIFNLEQTIVISKYPTKVMKPGKQTFVSLEITLFQIESKPLTSIEIQRSIYRITDELNTMFKNDKVFSYNKTKKHEM